MTVGTMPGRRHMPSVYAFFYHGFCFAVGITISFTGALV